MEANLSYIKALAKKMREGASYEAFTEEGHGFMKLWGVSIPSVKGFSPLDKIWSSVRKRNAETYSLNTVATFRPSEELSKGKRVKVIYGNFLVSLASIDEGEIGLYLEEFERTFDDQINAFIKALMLFLEDENLGYVRYCTLLAEHDPNAEEAEALVEAFLRANGLKTKADDKEKRHRKKMVKEHLRRAATTLI